MGQSVRLRAFAKANLSLNITGKNKDNGLHELDSVMLSLDAFDRSEERRVGKEC